MKLDKKKELAARMLKLGKERIVFNNQRLNEIKDVITREDIRSLVASGAIIIKEIKGRRTKEKRKTRRRIGSRKITPKRSKKKYVALTRKLRGYLALLKRKKEISGGLYIELRKEIRGHSFKSLAQMKEKIMEAKNESAKKKKIRKKNRL